MDTEDIKKNEPNGGDNKPQQKKSFVVRVYDGFVRFRDTKTGKWCTRILKGAGVGLVAYGSYKAGKKAVKPTTVYITEGVQEDIEEPEVEETNEEEQEHD